MVDMAHGAPKSEDLVPAWSQCLEDAEEEDEVVVPVHFESALYYLTVSPEEALRGFSALLETHVSYEMKEETEVIKLLHAMTVDNRYKKSWIIMGGEGWSPGMREFIKNHLPEWIPEMKDSVVILTTDEIINRGISLSK
jgi:hypothetical protein